MNKNEKKPYLPDERGDLEQKSMRIKAISLSGKDYTELPDPVRDPITCNNIICPEFDYTSKDLNKEDL